MCYCQKHNQKVQEKHWKKKLIWKKAIFEIFNLKIFADMADVSGSNHVKSKQSKSTAVEFRTFASVLVAEH